MGTEFKYLVWDFINDGYYFLAAQSSSRSLVVRQSVGRSTGLSSLWKVILRVSKGNENLPSYETVVTVVTVVTIVRKQLFHQKTFFYKKIFVSKKKYQETFCHQKNHKLKWWWNSKTKILMKLKYSNCDET